MSEKITVLGTALWGWTVEKGTCFELLDHFYARGLRFVDCATNYPINKDHGHFRAAEGILQAWISLNQVRDLKVIMKVGSTTNLGGPEINLRPSFLRLSADYYRTLLGPNLETLMIHWDHRVNDIDVEETASCLAELDQEGLRIGLSGLKYPDKYKILVDTLKTPPYLEVKHNYFSSQYPHYVALHGSVRCLVYGANAGGVSLQNRYAATSSFEQRGLQHHDFEEKLALIKETLGNVADPDKAFRKFLVEFAVSEPWAHGIIIGPSTVEQLQESLETLHHV